MLKRLLISFLLLASSSIYADMLQVGKALPTIELKNQHGKVIKVGDNVKTIVFAVEKTPSDLINSFLMKKDATFLANNKAYFIADISGMPSMITKMFAIPKMKKRPYDILLADKGEQSKVLTIPRKKNFVTVLKIAAGKIREIEFVDKVEQLTKAFK